MANEPNAPDERDPSSSSSAPRADSEPRGPDDHRTSPRLSTTATLVLAVVVFFIFLYAGYWVVSRLI